MAEIGQKFIKSGASYIELPDIIKKYESTKSKTLINPKNYDSKCFRYAVVSSLIYNSDKYDDKDFKKLSDPSYLSQTKISKKLKFDRLDENNFRVQDMNKFEELNNISISLFEMDINNECKVKIIRKTSIITNKKTKHVNLLYLSSEYKDSKDNKENEDDEDNKTLILDEHKKQKHTYKDIIRYGHYISILKLKNLVRHKGEICKYCFKKFYGKNAKINYKEHKLSNCDVSLNGKECKIILPSVDKCTIKSKKNDKIADFVYYADIESSLNNVDKKIGDKTIRYQEHKACGICLYKVCKNNPSENELWLRCHEESVYIFLTKIKSELNDLKEYYKSKEIKINNDNGIYNENIIKNVQTPDGESHIVEKKNPEWKKLKWFMPIIFHNGRSYDNHLIITELHKIFKGEKIDVIPNTSEKYMMINVGNRIKIMDSYLFLTSSLDDLVDTLTKTKNQKTGQEYRVYDDFKSIDDFKTFFPHLSRIITEYKTDIKLNITLDMMKMLCRKGVYFYEYISTFDKLEEKDFPSKDSFYSRLYGKGINDKEYKFAKNVWDEFKMDKCRDYHNLYLMQDVLLLAEVFERARVYLGEWLGEDPVKCISTPGMTYNAWVKDIEERDEDVKCFHKEQRNMMEMNRKGIRGGISIAPGKYSKVNNRHITASYIMKALGQQSNFNEKICLIISDYYFDENAKYILYVDAVSLYATAMLYPMPVGNYEWVKSKHIDYIDKKIRNYKLEDLLDNKKNKEIKIGYTLEIDCELPECIHDNLKDYPILPESKVVSENMISYHQKKEMKEMDIKLSNSPLLLTSLEPKKNYVIHMYNYNLYTRLGMKVTKIHRILSYDQEPILENYVRTNTERRKLSKSEFESSLIKLISNALYGKMIENMFKRINFKICSTYENFNEYLNDPGLQRWTVFNKNLIGVHMDKKDIKMNRPINIGFTILEISKFIMYNFYYNVMKVKYPNNSSLNEKDSIKLLMSDTDSLLMEISPKSGDLYKDINEDLKFKSFFDGSKCPKKHPLYFKENAKVPGKMCIEYAGTEIIKSYCLRAKMYNLKMINSIYDMYYTNEDTLQIDFDYNKIGKIKDVKDVIKSKGTKKETLKRKYKDDEECFDKCLFSDNINDKKQEDKGNKITHTLHKIYSDEFTKTTLCCFDGKFYQEDKFNTLPYGHYKIKDQKIEEDKININKRVKKE